MRITVEALGTLCLLLGTLQTVATVYGACTVLTRNVRLAAVCHLSIAGMAAGLYGAAEWPTIWLLSAVDLAQACTLWAGADYRAIAKRRNGGHKCPPPLIHR